ncbi:MAG: hypothetical protein ACHQM6_07325, partial [Candidatus Kapaibacterium sp.]
VYLPNKIQTPIFHEKGEVYASASYTGNSGYGATLAYSPINSLFIEAGGNLTPAVKPFISNNSTKFFYAEIGYYKWPASFAEVELSGGYGRGISETYDNFPENIFDTSYSAWYYGNGNEFDHKNVNYNRFHLQASLGLQAQLHESESGNHEKDFILEFALTPRLAFLQTSKYTIDHYDTNHVFIGTRNESFSNTFLEFGITLRAGVEHLMLELQSGSSSALGSNQAILSQGSFLSVGLVSRF